MLSGGLAVSLLAAAAAIRDMSLTKTAVKLNFRYNISQTPAYNKGP